MYLKFFKKFLTRLIIYAILTAGAILVLFPVAWLISRSFMRLEDTARDIWIPNPFTLEAYIEVFTQQPFFRYLLNTSFVTFMGVLGTLLSSSLVAFGFSFLRFKGRDLIFLLVLSTMMLPGEVTMIPIYRIFYFLGWINTFKPLFVPSFFGSAFFIFLLRQFFLTIPRDLVDAAYIDGASSFRVWWQIILPLSRPALTTVAVFSFLGHWNDLLGPLIYISSTEKYTLSLALLSYKNLYFRYTNLLSAATLISILPCIIIFFLAQRAFLEGIVTTGLRG
ncbi:MAG: sugar ABC transporter ATP-binding protein [Dictyoglomus sp. NZ13-RE01]|nr:MAG: sugar ABC transporter ATP-binding protein [Dictyoglomus sp. NZ13-RE01]